MSLRFAQRVVLVALALPIAQAPARDAAPPAGRGIIRGLVTAADTARPLPRANVFALSVGITPAESRTVVTDEKGRYEFSGLKAGRYTLHARKAGYLGLAYGQVRARESARPVVLSESMPLDKIDFVLPRASVIVARIVDRFGDPVRGVVVRVHQPRFVDGERQLSDAGGGTFSITDDRGETRLFGLAPDDYYLTASPEFLTRWRGEIETLHPGTLDVAEARPVRVDVGEEVFATFPILRAAPSSLSGRILGADGTPLAATYVSLQHSQLSGGSSRRMNVAPDGSFHEENLSPGDWTIVVREPEYGTARVRLLGDDIQGLVVRTRSAATVRGRVTFEGAPPPAEGLDLGVSFEGPRTLVSGAGFLRSGTSVSTIRATAETNWTFEARVSGAGVIRSRTGAWLLKAVLLDGKDVTDTALDFGSAYAGKPVEVVVTQRRAQVNGSVSNDRGQPARDYVALLFPEDEAQWTLSSSRFFATGRPDQQGAFTINNLPPGRYLATAVESLESGEERNPETLARLRGSATAIQLQESESRTLALRMSR
jgi:hypothetical protein